MVARTLLSVGLVAVAGALSLGDSFRPFGGETGAWEHTGIVPDIEVPTRWDLFTEATDPGLAAAIDLLAAD